MRSEPVSLEFLSRLPWVMDYIWALTVKETLSSQVTFGLGVFIAAIGILRQCMCGMYMCMLCAHPSTWCKYAMDICNMHLCAVCICVCTYLWYMCVCCAHMWGGVYECDQCAEYMYFQCACAVHVWQCTMWWYLWVCSVLTLPHLPYGIVFYSRIQALSALWTMNLFKDRAQHYAYLPNKEEPMWHLQLPEICPWL